MLVEHGKITGLQNIADQLFDLRLACPQIAALSLPGQFVHVQCDGLTLRRPISICGANSGQIRLVFQEKGEGTAWLSQQKPGSVLDVLGPLGNGFDLGRTEGPAVFVGGGIGSPPLLYAASKYGADATVLLGFRSKSAVILKNDFESAGCKVEITTDDGSEGFHGLVTELLSARLRRGPCKTIFACGPRPMLKAVSLVALECGIPCQVSMEERMACGVGACLGCAVRVRENGVEKYLHVCKNGPVFDSRAIVW